MNKDCDIKNNIDVNENPVQVAKKRRSICQKMFLIQIVHLNQTQSASQNSKKSE